MEGNEASFSDIEEAGLLEQQWLTSYNLEQIFLVNDDKMKLRGQCNCNDESDAAAKQCERRSC